MEARYQILYPLERGSSIEKFLVADRLCSMGKKVLTLLPPKAWPAGELFHQFSRRRQLEHPFLVPVEDLVYRSKRPGLISRYVQGTPLAARPGDRVLDQGRILAVRLLDLLLFLHRRGFYCGGLPPSKVYLDDDGLPQVNILFSLEAASYANRASAEMSQYFAPEFLLHGTQSVAADYYSFGMLLYRLFTGFPPFSEEDPAVLRQKLFVAEPVSPGELRPKLPESISRLIVDLTRKDPALRPSSPRYIRRMIMPGSGIHAAVPPFRAPLIGREEILEKSRCLLETFQTGSRPAFFGLAGSAGIGTSRLLEEIEILAKALKLGSSCVRWDGGASFSTAGSASDPMVLLLHDLHRADTRSLKEIDRRVSSGGAAVVVANFCCDRISPPLRQFLAGMRSQCRPFEICDIRGLNGAAVCRLLESLTGSSIPKPLLRELEKHSAGNPSHLLDLLVLLRRQKMLSYSQGHWKWNAKSVRTMVIPRSITENIQGRLSLLRRSSLRILEILSIAGDAMPLPQLAELSGLKPEILEKGIEELVQLDLVTFRGRLVENRLEVRSGQISRIVSRSLSSTRRRGLHRLIAGSLYPSAEQGEAVEAMEAVSRHLLLSHGAGEARRVLQKTVNLLREKGQLGRAEKLVALGFKTQVLSRVDWKWLKVLIEVQFCAGRVEECLRTLWYARKHCNIPQQDQLSFITNYLGRLYAIRGDSRKAEECFELVSQSEEASADPHLKMDIQGAQLGVWSLSGKTARATETAGELIQSVSRCPEGQVSSRVHHSLATYFHERGDSGAFLFHECRAIAADPGDLNVTQWLGRLCNVAGTYIHLGNVAKAATVLDFCLDEARSRENRDMELLAESVFLNLERRRGHHSRAVSRLEEMKDESAHVKYPANLWAEVRLELAKNYNYLGQPERAVKSLGSLWKYLDQRQVVSSWIDAKLTLGWSWLLLRDQERVFRECEGLKAVVSKRREEGRFWSLMARACAAAGKMEQGRTCGRSALAGAAGTSPYYRAKIILQLAAVWLSADRPDEALGLLREANRIVWQVDLKPLWITWLLFRADLQKRMGEDKAARGLLLRANELATDCERPELRLAVWTRMAELFEQGAGDAQAARFTGMSRLLRREQAARSEARGRIERNSPGSPPKSASEGAVAMDLRREGTLMGVLRRFAMRLESKGGPPTVYSGASEAVRIALPGLSFCFYVREHGGANFRIFSSRGRCVDSGRQLLERASVETRRSGEQWQGAMGSETEIGFGVPVYSRDDVVAFFYCESRTRLLSEEQLDFLTCLARIAELRLTAQGSEQRPGKKAGPGLVLESGLRLVGRSPEMEQMVESIRRIAPSRATVLIEGETGTGKELVARAVHELSPRRRGPFLALNCSAIPAELIENELFGHIEGSFTGASRPKPGLFEAASGGTLFLDEVASMSPSVQSRLLRVLQERKVRRIGDVRERAVDVRIVAATNQSLVELVRESSFRADLYHRLNVARILVPPLRERKSDLELLGEYFLQRFCEREQRVVRFSAEAWGRMLGYDFPGNVRELENMVESLCYFSRAEVVSADDVGRWFDRSHADTGSRERSRAETIFEDLITGRTGFWEGVREPFLRRDLSRREVRRLITLGLEASGGSYRGLAQNFHLPRSEYKKLLSFLSHHGCKLDFRPFRRRVS